MNEEQINKLLQTVEPFIRRSKESQSEFLNPDFACLLWWSQHSVAKAADYLKQIGVTSYQNKPYTRAAIHLAAKKSKYYIEERAKFADKRQRLIRKIRSDAKRAK